MAKTRKVSMMLLDRVVTRRTPFKSSLLMSTKIKGTVHLVFRLSAALWSHVRVVIVVIVIVQDPRPLHPNS